MSKQTSFIDSLITPLINSNNQIQRILARNNQAIIISSKEEVNRVEINFLSYIGYSKSNKILTIDEKNKLYIFDIMSMIALSQYPIISRLESIIADLNIDSNINIRDLCIIVNSIMDNITFINTSDNILNNEYRISSEVVETFLPNNIYINK